jgi:hypothetical protein
MEMFFRAVEIYIFNRRICQHFYLGCFCPRVSLADTVIASNEGDYVLREKYSEESLFSTGIMTNTASFVGFCRGHRHSSLNRLVSVVT